MDGQGQGKHEKGSHLGGGHVTKEMLGEIDVRDTQMQCVFQPASDMLEKSHRAAVVLILEHHHSGEDPQSRLHGGRYNESNIRAAFETSLSSGVTLLNTAQIYYTSEDCIGLGGKSQLRTSSPSGSKVEITLPGEFSGKKYWAKFWAKLCHKQRSIEKCKVDALDGFLIHFPKGSPEAVADQLAVAYQRGLVRNVGVSNYDEAALRQMHGLLMKDRGVPLIFNEIEFSLLRRMPETSGLLKVCKELGVTVLAWAPLASGRLTSKPCTEQITDSDTVACLEQVKTLAAKYQKTPAQVALNWCICKGTVPIPGARTLEQAQENAGALGWQLTAEEAA
ncbi:unnamed protein product [Durusdinium trenchii]|uniref:NADP-dependent oxidoreductase domain-containing protein n=1 Tax=Durusdinium trenchii TaxID=1381693 RepID=A0ABP0QSX0_9DINO